MALGSIYKKNGKVLNSEESTVSLTVKANYRYRSILSNGTESWQNLHGPKIS